MGDITVSNSIDTFMQSVDQAEMRTRLSLGDSATKNTGTTAGTVAAGDDSRITGALQTSGGTMTGKLTAAADNTIAKLSVGARTTGSSPTALADGDIWISNQGALSYRDSTGPTSRAVAATSLSNTFNQPQTIGSTANAGAVLSVSNSGTREVVTISNTATSTSDAVVITNLGSGNSLVINDETTPDSTRFAVANNGRVGIGVAPDAVAALAVDSTGIKFSDGTTQTTAASGGSGTVTSITAGTGLTGGTITASGTVAADFGTTTGKVTEGGTTVLKVGDTMTGKLTLPAATNAAAPLNIGSSGVQPTTPATGDVWIRNNALQYKGSSAIVNTVAATAEPNQFSARQVISVTDNSNPALRVTQLGTGEAFRVEDETNPDATAFVVSASGRVGVGVTPDAAVALSVDATGIKFSDGTIQTTAGGAGGVSSFSAGTTGLSPATSTTGAVTLAGTLNVANGGTGATTLTGIVKGSGTSALSAAVAGTDYVIPSGNITGTASNVTGTVAIANGGTGNTTQQAAINALAGATTSGQYLRGNGTNVTLSAIQAADVPTLNQNTTGTASNVTGTVAVANGGTGATTLTGLVKGNGTSAFTAANAGTDYVVPSGSITGTASNVTGTVAIANGGTGQTTAANAINALVPAQSGQSGKVLTTDGSVVSWGTAGGSGITALTGDVSASGTGSVSSTVTGLRSRVVSATAPSAGQVLGWNATTNEWEPTSAGGAVSYDVLRVFITGPTTGIYTIPSGYKLADIYACSGGGGGGSGAYSSSAGFPVLSGGGGGAHGIFGLRKSINVNGGSIQYDIGAGGNGGVFDINGYGSAGQAGAGTLISYYSLPSGVGSSSIILDCGYYINNASLSNTAGQAGGYGNVNGGSIYYPNTWVQNTQNGGNAPSSSPGLPPNSNQYFVETTYVSSGGGGGGLTSGSAVYNGGNILDPNYILYSSGVAIPFNGTTTSSSTIDATPVQFYPNLNIFWGGAGGAAADSSIAYYNGTTYRAGRGADGQYGCGGGGGGSMYDDLGAGPNIYSGGNGGNGGAGFLLMYLYK